MVGTATIEASIGFDWLDGAHFPVSGLSGDLVRVGVLDFRFGVAPNVEVEFDGVGQNFLEIERRDDAAIPPHLLDESSTNDVGDFSIATKIQMRPEGSSAPWLGVRFGVQLPTSNQARGIGWNATNAFGAFIAGKSFGGDSRLRVFGNFGVLVLAAPAEPNSQNDLLTYGVAAVYRVQPLLSLVSEVAGRENTRSARAPLGTESMAELRAGVRLHVGSFTFDLAGIHGLKDASPDGGATLGVTWRVRPWGDAGQ
jgi:Putative MetA-pathway of phenol degradation